MSNVAVIGSQWGDEGKGKIVDWLSEKADVIVRFQGGHNAGHTLVVNNVTYKLKLLPSGIVRKNKISIIGNGVVIDPWALLDEIKQIKKLGIKVSNKNLYIFVSQSGETADTYAALDLCKKNNVKTCSIVNVVESSIARTSDFVLPIHAGPEIGVASTKAFIGQMLVLYLLVLKMSEVRKEISKINYVKKIRELKKLHEEGVLTDDEFEKAKKKVLSQ